MANKKDITREELLDKVERLYIMGLRKPYHILKLLNEIGDFRTAKEYLHIATRRVQRRNRNLNKDLLLQSQLTSIDQTIAELWMLYLTTQNPNERVGAINAIGRMLKQKAELLGLEAPKEVKIGGMPGENLAALLLKMPEKDAKRIIEQLDAVRSKPNK